MKKIILVTLIALAVSYSTVFSQISIKKGSVLSCHDQAKAVVWQSLTKQAWFSDFGTCSDRLRTREIKSGNTKILVVSGYGPGLCGATGNCATWVVTRRQKRCKIILDAGSVIQTVDVRRRGLNLYPDLAFRGRMGASDHYLGTFRYDGNRYRLTQCTYEVYDTYGKRSITKAARKFCSP